MGKATSSMTDKQLLRRAKRYNREHPITDDFLRALLTALRYRCGYGADKRYYNNPNDGCYEKGNVSTRY